MQAQEQFKFSPEQCFFTSDLHVGHQRIIEYSNRPFSSVEEMNETLIKNWNETVPKDGIVFDLGDFAIGGSNVWKSTLPRLNGKHYLILGNHDVKNYRKGYEEYFSFVTWQMHIEIEKNSIWLNHLPFLCFGGAYREQHNVWQLYGHVHTNERKEGKDTKRMEMCFPTQYDVGVDNNNFRPISYYEVKNKIEEQLKNYKNDKQL